MTPPRSRECRLPHSHLLLLATLLGLIVFLSLEGILSVVNYAQTPAILTLLATHTGFVVEDPTRKRIEDGRGQRISRDCTSIVEEDDSQKKLPLPGAADGILGDSEDGRRKILLSLWEDSPYLGLTKIAAASKSNRAGSSISKLFPRPPHMEDCKSRLAKYKRWDRRRKDGSYPRWSIWEDMQVGDSEYNHDSQKRMILNLTTAPVPPWVEGADADNLPMTRRVQRDLWFHQHPKNCSDPNLKFLYVTWDTRRNIGLGAMITSMAGFLAIALRENRILVTNYFSRADHAGCSGSGRAHWHCYFLPETSTQCRNHAIDLASQPEAWNRGILKNNTNYRMKQIWFGQIPGNWGSSWEHMQPTSEIEGKLLVHHPAKDLRWWRAQAVRYLMRFPTEYTCNLMNQARHQAFGSKAAEMVLHHLPKRWLEVTEISKETEMEKFVWERYRPWVPRPLISMHVRLGDKAKEMKMVGFRVYMDLAYRLRERFPHVESIWLSTEMQDVIDESKTWEGWNFYYTNISRQLGAMSMESYETRLGKEVSTANAIVNFLMAADADFYIGALGSTWCSLIDGMRTTSGKQMAGYLSVNKDRFW